MITCDLDYLKFTIIGQRTIYFSKTINQIATPPTMAMNAISIANSIFSHQRYPSELHLFLSSLSTFGQHLDASRYAFVMEESYKGPVNPSDNRKG